MDLHISTSAASSYHCILIITPLIIIFIVYYLAMTKDELVDALKKGSAFWKQVKARDHTLHSSDFKEALTYHT